MALYARSATFEFVQADDADLIAGNQTFLSRLSNLPDAFTRSYFATERDVGDLETYYRPVTIASFMVDAQRGGARPAAYHATNVALHVVAVVLLFVLLRAFGSTSAAASAAALLFAVHPLNAPVVCWIAGRNELLFGVFTLAAMAALAGAPPDKGRWLALHVAAFALALFSKETAILIPGLALLYLWLWHRPMFRRTALALGPCYAAVIGVWWALRARALAGSPDSVSIGEAVANAPQILVHLGKLVVPIDLNVMPGIDRSALWLGALAVVAGAAAARRLPWRVTSFSAVWLVGFLAPTLAVPDLPVYEHRMYVPMMGAALGLSSALDRWRHPRAVTAATVVAAVFALQAWSHSSVYRNPSSYWENGTQSRTFAPIAHVNLGQLHEQGGNLARAMDEYRRALALDPNTPKAHNNLGVVLMRQQQPQLAVEHFFEETKRHPQNADAWFNLGLWAEMRGEATEARRYYERAITANAAYVPAYEKLGRRPPGR